MLDIGKHIEEIKNEIESLRELRDCYQDGCIKDLYNAEIMKLRSHLIAFGEFDKMLGELQHELAV